MYQIVCINVICIFFCACVQLTIQNFMFSSSIFPFSFPIRDLGESNLTFERLERNARRLKNNKFPKMPRSPHDIIEAFKDPDTRDKYAFNLRKTKRFYMDTVILEDSSYFTIFASYQAIDMIEKHIPENRNYLIDGTFKVATMGFYQLLIIHIEVENDVIPIIYVLLSGKSCDLYLEVFKYIENNIFKLKPTRFMADFESGLRKAINEYYPQAILNGCWYHFCACIRRYFLSHQLYELICDVPIANVIYRSMMNLPLLPPESILAGYNIVKRWAKDNKLMKEFKPIFAYFDSFWMAMVSLVLKFRSNIISKPCNS